MLVVLLASEAHGVLNSTLGGQQCDVFPHWAPDSIFIKTLCTVPALGEISAATREISECASAPGQRTLGLFHRGVSATIGLSQVHLLGEQKVTIMVSCSSGNQSFLLVPSATAKALRAGPELAFRGDQHFIRLFFIK